MGRDWIIDVLADLRTFAQENDLPLLAAQLDEAGLVAEVEIAQSIGQVKRQPVTDTAGRCIFVESGDRIDRRG